MNGERDLLSIEAVSRKLRIQKHTLRFWEKEFEGMLIPSRTHGGQRRYAPENIVMIEEIHRLRRNGMALPEIKKKMMMNNKRNLDDSGQIDLLANRVAEAVKVEVYQFFGKENQGSSNQD